MPELDTQYEATNQRLLNEAGRALREAASFTAQIEQTEYELPQTDTAFDTKPVPEVAEPSELSTNVSLQPPGNVSSSRIDPPPEPDIEKPDLNNVLQDLDAKDLTGSLEGRLKEWKDTFFPALSNGFAGVPEQWLMQVLDGTYPLGMDERVFRKVWQRARDREESQRQSSLREASVELSQRGFSIPPGAYVAAVDRARRETDRAVQEINVEQALREEEVRVNMLQFAAERAAQLRQGLTSVVADYLRAWTSIEAETELEKARIRSQMFGTYYEALRSYYNVESTFAELRVQAERSSEELSQQAQRTNAELGLQAEQAGAELNANASIQNSKNYLDALIANNRNATQNSELELEASKAKVNAELQSQKNEVDLKTQDPSMPALAQAIRGLSDIAASTSSAAGTLLAQIEGV